MSGPPRVAVVGMGGLFPSAVNPEGLWADVLAAADRSRDVPPGRWMLDPDDIFDLTVAAPDRVYSHRGYFLDEIPRDLSDPAGGLDAVIHLTLAAGRQAFTSGVTAYARPPPRRRHPGRHRFAHRKGVHSRTQHPGPHLRGKAARPGAAGRGRRSAQPPCGRSAGRGAGRRTRPGRPPSHAGRGLRFFPLCDQVSRRRAARRAGRRHAGRRRVAAGLPVHADGVRPAAGAVAERPVQPVRRAGRRPGGRRGGRRVPAEAAGGRRARRRPRSGGDRRRRPVQRRGRRPAGAEQRRPAAGHARRLPRRRGGRRTTWT